jgi:outer membrane protein OmpA-like peptidoglycan-associated protein
MQDDRTISLTGAERAQTAKDYLTTLGVPAQRFSTISYREELRDVARRIKTAGRKTVDHL